MNILILGAGQVGRRGRGWWRAILDQYGADDVLIPTVELRRSYPGGPIVGVQIENEYHPGQGGIEHMQTLLQLAHAYDQATGWVKKRPPSLLG